MTSEQITQIVRQMLLVALEIAAPFLLIALIVGILISLVQAATRIQEMTLTFVPKMVVVAVTLAIFFPWMLKMLTKFTNNLLLHQWDKVTSLTHYVQ